MMVSSWRSSIWRRSAVDDAGVADEAHGWPRDSHKTVSGKPRAVQPGVCDLGSDTGVREARVHRRVSGSRKGHRAWPGAGLRIVPMNRLWPMRWPDSNVGNVTGSSPFLESCSRLTSVAFIRHPNQSAQRIRQHENVLQFVQPESIRCCRNWR